MPRSKDTQEYLPWREGPPVVIPPETLVKPLNSAELTHRYLADFFRSFLRRSKLYLNYPIEGYDPQPYVSHFSQLSVSETNGQYTILCSTRPAKNPAEILALFGVSYTMKRDVVNCSVVRFDRKTGALFSGPACSFRLDRPYDFLSDQNLMHVHNICTELEDFLQVVMERNVTAKSKK